MTSERLATLRFIARCGTICIDDLAVNQSLSYSAARYRLCRAKQSGLVSAEVDRRVTVRPGHGSPGLAWSISRKGAQRLQYLEQHPEKVKRPVRRRRTQSPWFF